MNSAGKNTTMKEQVSESKQLVHGDEINLVIEVLMIVIFLYTKDEQREALIDAADFVLPIVDSAKSLSGAQLTHVSEFEEACACHEFLLTARVCVLLHVALFATCSQLKTTIDIEQRDYLFLMLKL
jgi:hypothetical protein